MADDTLQSESFPTTAAIRDAMLAAARKVTGHSPEAKEAAAMEYAAGAVRAAMDALAALDAIDIGELIDGIGDASSRNTETADRLLRLSRRRLREAVGQNFHPGEDAFIDMIGEHGLCIYD